MYVYVCLQAGWATGMRETTRISSSSSNRSHYAVAFLLSNCLLIYHLPSNALMGWGEECCVLQVCPSVLREKVKAFGKDASDASDMSDIASDNVSDASGVYVSSSLWLSASVVYLPAYICLSAVM